MSEAKIFKRFLFLCLVLACAFSAAEELEVAGIRVPGEPVARFEKAEITFSVGGNWENPFDPDQIDVVAHITSPSGRQIVVPAFYCQPCRSKIVTPGEQRQRVQLLRFYISEAEWPPRADIEFFLDDVRVTSTGSGTELLIDDMEGDNPHRLERRGVAEPSTEVVHSGKRSLRFKPEVAGEENWPGVGWKFDGADWSAYDKVTMWVYPKTKGVQGPVHLYFCDAQFGNSPIEKWEVAPGGFKAETWNRLEWNWQGFGRSLGFEGEGQPIWMVRFAPTETGQYSFHVTARDKTGEVKSEVHKFEAALSPQPGFVRVSKKDPHYFEFDNGAGFFTIGHDVPANVGDALEYFPKMQAAGENCTYVIMYPNRLAIEWEKLGRYNQQAAAALDWYVEWAKKHGIYFKLSFDEHCVNRPSSMWGKNPYNAANGGPCKGVNDFFTSEDARRLYKKRIRYILARWAYSTNIMGWEYFAETDGPTSLKGKEGWRYPYLEGGEEISRMLVKWIREMSKFVRDNDPYGHLITESFGGGVSDPNIWAMPEIEYTQIHEYNVPDAAGALSDWCLKLTKEYPKPMQVTEFGWMTKPIDRQVDPTGICLHNGIWASVASGAAGTAMTWWCRRVDELNLYRHYRAIANFVEGINWTEQNFKPLQTTVRMPVADHYVDVSIPAAGPFSGAAVTRFTIARDGTANDPKQVPQILLARGRKEPRTVPEFEVDYPQAGRFIIRVDSVSPDALLEVHVDGKLALRKELPAENVQGKACTFDARWKVWRCIYDEDVSVEVPSGRHRIRLENAHPGGSWIRVSSYTLSNYSPPAIRALGLSGRSLSILWVQNKESTWWNEKLGRHPKPIGGAKVDIALAEDGQYDVEWWDTYKGILLLSKRLKSNRKILTISVPALERDCAYKIRWAGGR